MTIPILLSKLPEPELEFGGRDVDADPKSGLTRSGPFSLQYGGGHPSQTRIGIVGPPSMIAKATSWFERCRGTVLSGGTNRRRFPDFPGFASVFHSSLELADRWKYEISDLRLARALGLTKNARFDSIVDLYLEGIRALTTREMGPALVICGIPEEVLRTTATLQQAGPQRLSLTPRGRREQLPLPFDFGESGDAEHLAFRTLRRAIKGKVMLLRDRVPVQLATDHLFLDGPEKDDPATRAWSVGVGLFYKAGGIPWRLAYDSPHVCYVGISFHRLVTTTRTLMYSSIAQAFSSEIDGFVLRGDRIPWTDGTEVHLSEDQAAHLARAVVSEYRERAGRTPTRVTIHKTSVYSDAEVAGFHRGFADIGTLELLSVRGSDLRLMPETKYPPPRGTALIVGEEKICLYTTGFYPDWGTYPGPHIPQPIEIQGGGADIRRVCEETLALTKMNWNAASVGGKFPITMQMAGVVGPIMAEVPEDVDPELSYRYYM